MKPTVYDLSDYHALIRQIRAIDRAGGDSTLARLVTADWLEERGEAERAEFIRVQVRYAVIHQGETAERDELSDLLQSRFRIRTGGAQTPFAPDCPNRLWPQERYGDEPREWDWMRGWISAVRCPLAWWLARGPDICRRHPVREVVITDRRPHPVNRIHDTREPGVESVSEWGWGYWPEPESPHPTAAVFDQFFREESDAAPVLNAAALRWAESEADRPAATEAHAR